MFRLSEHLNYGVCEFCHSYKSMVAPAPETIYDAGYWTHARGHSTLSEQVYNCERHREGGKSKYEYVLERIQVEDRSAALEIGCAPGKLLQLLRGIARFENVTGIEACAEFGPDIRHGGCFGGPLLFGFFPSITKELDAESFSLILALDVYEHSHEPEAFLAESARLLKPNGQLLLMLPLASNDLEPRFFAPEEHVWIHSLGNMAAMLKVGGFGSMDVSRWTNGHDLLSARRTD